MSSDPVLIIGATGQLGTAFTRLLREAVPVTRTRLDLATATVEGMRGFIAEMQPSAVINCAAYTRVDAAESDEASATAINGHSVGFLALATADLDIPFVTYSSDYVFDGRSDRPYLESDPTHPLNAYGRSKLTGERLTLSSNQRALIIRTSWVLSPTHPNFVRTILSRVAQGQSVRVVDDQWGCPTMVDDLVGASLAALNSGATGVLHLTNRGPTTWYDLARTSVELAGLNPALVEPCPTDEFPTPARRPAYSVLGSEVVPRLGISPLPRWEDSIRRVVDGQTTN